MTKLIFLHEPYPFRDLSIHQTLVIECIQVNPHKLDHIRTIWVFFLFFILCRKNNIWVFVGGNCPTYTCQVFSSQTLCINRIIPDHMLVIALGNFNSKYDNQCPFPFQVICEYLFLTCFIHMLH